jgi:hypothetical protein
MAAFQHLRPYASLCQRTSRTEPRSPRADDDDIVSDVSHDPLPPFPISALGASLIVSQSQDATGTPDPRLREGGPHNREPECRQGLDGLVDQREAEIWSSDDDVLEPDSEPDSIWPSSSVVAG